MGDELQYAEINSILELTDSVINRKYLPFLTNEKKYKLMDVPVKDLSIR